METWPSRPRAFVSFESRRMKSITWPCGSHSHSRFTSIPPALLRLKPDDGIRTRRVQSQQHGRRRRAAPGDQLCRRRRPRRRRLACLVTSGDSQEGGHHAVRNAPSPLPPASRNLFFFLFLMSDKDTDLNIFRHR
jgi:hypothetical protein